ncbi:MAG: hypothetical protein AAGI11_06165 [Pseudomonadota bacterium]
MPRSLPGIALALMLGACASQPEPPQRTLCEDPRPQVCTMEYNPVCALRTAGGWETYSSPCNACADDRVFSHLPAACPEDE